ncbi:MAG: hypothetical protein GXP53_01945 [Deltaproteobacteria bacterium]|nr:hypothetical protein [Deltaproteobacteria bacterium]
MSRNIDCLTGRHPYFNEEEMEVVDQSVAVAEELVNNHYKLSTSQMAQLNYDVKTSAHLLAREKAEEHFAQIVRYSAKRKGAVLETDTEDFYKICIQDTAILSALKKTTDLCLPPFLLYIVCHELIHIVRFRRFLQNFNAPFAERHAEESRVHGRTHDLLAGKRIEGIRQTLTFFEAWRSDGFGERDV